MNALLLRRILWSVLAPLVMAGVCAVAGCTKSEKPPAAAVENSGRSSLPTAAIGAPAADDEPEEPDDPEDAKAARVELKEGSPEWLIRESMKLRLEAPPKSEDVEVLKTHRKERNEKIVKMCQQAIALVHQDPEKERLFSAAVHNMLEARLQQALAGDRESVDALYDDGAALFERDPKSAAAADAAHTLVNLAYSMAKGGAGSNPQWLSEFARQAAHFAGSFPAEERRSLPLLFTAARSCELAGMTKEATEGYTLIQQQFPQSQYAARVTGILRRLKLPGNPPQFSGPTLDGEKGEQLVLDDLVGSPVLVVFWSSTAKPFVDGLPSLLEVTRKQAMQGLKVVGVTVDSEATVVSQFAVKHRIPWPQVFFNEPDKQGWNNPIVNYYGIMEVPALWLIDPSGNVVSTSVTIESLDREIQKLTTGTTESAQAVGKSEVTPAAGTDAEAPKKSEKKPARKQAPKEEEDEPVR
jgi:Thioredoxin-like